MSISVVIPVMRWDLVIDLLRDISFNTVKPEHVFIINNAQKPFNIPKLNFSIEILDFGKNVGVNAAWNYAIKNSKSGNDVSVLNDDIRINQYFFERTGLSLRSNSQIGVICPKTNDIDKVIASMFYGRNVLSHDINIEIMRKREGWAFTISNIFKDILPLIPEELFVFCGDDWIWSWAKELGFVWAKDNNNLIYHRIGGTLREKENRPLRALLRKEKSLFSQLIRKAIDEKRG